MTSPAVRPVLSVMIMVWAQTGWTAAAKPLTTDVTMKPRRVKIGRR
ncbi:MAG: hypothetical protein WDO24_16015 [Pseudomonadota bacterium]